MTIRILIGETRDAKCVLGNEPKQHIIIEQSKPSIHMLSRLFLSCHSKQDDMLFKICKTVTALLNTFIDHDEKNS